jgi:hypothetical protein
MAELTRRAALVGTAALAAAVPTAGAAAVVDPRSSAEGQIAMEACRDGHPAVWTYAGFIYAVRPGERPRAILGLAGGTTSWASRETNGDWRLRGATMSFFRDPDSGAFLDAFANPFTGRTTEVRSNILSGGGMRFPADGSAARFIGRSRAGETTPGGFNVADPGRPLGRVDWTQTADTVMLLTDHAFEVPVQPQLEARTIFADRSAFLDRRVRRLPARMTTSTITPWLRFMNMADAPGHLVWHCSGEKLFDAANLPADYRARAGSMLDTLVTPPAA